MRALVLGGTGWLGRAVVDDLLASGCEVTCLARGESGAVPSGAALVRVDRRAPGAYDAVGADWDEVIEFSSEPDLVEPALDALGPRAAHWTLVSTVSVYVRDDEPGADESAAVVEPVDPTRYADRKVLAERRSAERVGDRLSIVRPGLIVGAGDPSDRFGYWPARFSRGGPALAPVLDGRFAQVIDVGDLARWIGNAALIGHCGVVNTVGDPLPLDDLLRCVAEVAGYDGEIVEVDDATLLAHDIRYWAGPRSLPLWLPAEAVGFAQRSSRAFRASGGFTRPMADSVAAVLADERARGLDRVRRAGLASSEERELLVGLGLG
ncbi:NAD-dependent epimerase/dehydratase family protein [Schumannella sp. 10F1B-5-1]|uniref:NAD-dependent epimerase/dehydratase family protein n=1 Tax=Schumannella sp. 10F1B-5-1 TaxID=2590780 RepID=UPI00113194CB|nr:NAD-dependent epimerase/dehydratase family protein [Schumannella sp. 10F1B-5-1]TPW72995.1 reductase [Schumannella sp. 10F1B-5-1]